MHSIRVALLYLLSLYGLVPRPAPRQRRWIDIGPRAIG